MKKVYAWLSSEQGHRIMRQILLGLNVVLFFSLLAKWNGC